MNLYGLVVMYAIGNCLLVYSHSITPPKTKLTSSSHFEIITSVKNAGITVLLTASSVTDAHTGYILTVLVWQQMILIFIAILTKTISVVNAAKCVNSLIIPSAVALVSLNKIHSAQILPLLITVLRRSQIVWIVMILAARLSIMFLIALYRFPLPPAPPLIKYHLS